MAKTPRLNYADASNPGLLSAGAQTIPGVKTFPAAPVFNAGMAVDTNTLVVDDVNNRVGIGTTSPQYPLDVAGSARLNRCFAGSALSPNAVSILSAANSVQYFTLVNNKYIIVSIQGGGIITIFDASGGAASYVGCSVGASLTALAFDSGPFSSSDTGASLRVFHSGSYGVAIRNSTGSDRAISIFVTSAWVVTIGDQT